MTIGGLDRLTFRKNDGRLARCVCFVFKGLGSPIWGKGWASLV